MDQRRLVRPGHASRDTAAAVGGPSDLDLDSCVPLQLVNLPSPVLVPSSPPGSAEKTLSKGLPSSGSSRRLSWLHSGSRILSRRLASRSILSPAGIGSSLSARRRALNGAVSAVSVAAVVLQIIDIETYTRYGNGDAPGSFGLRAAVTALSALLCVLLGYGATLHHSSMKAQSQFYRHGSILASGALWRLVPELLAAIAHLPPAVRFEVASKQVFRESVESYNESVLSPLVFLRLFFLLRSARDASYVYSGSGRLLCHSQRLHVGLPFLFRASVARRPFLTISAMTVSSLAVFSYWLLIFERPFAGVGQGYSFQTAVWHVFVSMTTVGYGDIVPKSYLGRAVLSIAILWGLLVFAFLTGLVLERSKLLGSEAAVVSLLTEGNLRRRYREAAALAIQRLWRWRRRRAPGAAYGASEMRALENWGRARRELEHWVHLNRAPAEASSSGSDLSRDRKQAASPAAAASSLAAACSCTCGERATELRRELEELRAELRGGLAEVLHEVRRRRKKGGEHRGAHHAKQKGAGVEASKAPDGPAARTQEASPISNSPQAQEQ
eukprot:tig00000144_g9163.t1